jgi:predicted nucleotidyltransferase
MIIYEEILRAFQKEKVKYVLVGGIAVNILGLFRSTADLDILVQMSDSNLAKIVKILKKNSYFVKQPVDPMKISDKATREKWIRDKHMRAFNFYKKNGLEEVDLIIDSPVAFEEARKSALRVKVGGVTVPVISVDNLIKMKSKAGRAIDKFDIVELKKIKRMLRK